MDHCSRFLMRQIIAILGYWRKDEKMASVLNNLLVTCLIGDGYG